MNLSTFKMLAVEEGRRQAERAIVEMLKCEDLKCWEYLGGKGRDCEKRIQQEHYSESMNWTIEAIECGDHDG